MNQLAVGGGAASVMRPSYGLTFEDAGEHELKGIHDRWHLYRVAK
jgi:hypothetical protein